VSSDARRLGAHGFALREANAAPKSTGHIELIAGAIGRVGQGVTFLTARDCVGMVILKVGLQSGPITQIVPMPAVALIYVVVPESSGRDCSSGFISQR
jgi:hypothetical protein